MKGRVIALGSARAAAAPIESKQSLRLAIAHGVVGDRYGEDEGPFQGFPDQDVTLVEAEDARRVGVDPLALRRNIVVDGVALEELIGRSFTVGSATLHGMRRCLPCGHLSKLLGKPDLKDTLRGGLRARIVYGGEVRVGDAIAPARVTLDKDMRAVVESAHLAFVATVTADGMPNLSPKGTIRVLDENRLSFLEIASPQTRRNIEKHPWMEVNVVDTTSRRGYRFFGRASIHAGDADDEAAQERIAREEGARYENRGTVVLDIERALPLVSPGYHGAVDEHAMRGAWKVRRAALNAAFDAHVATRGPFARGA